MFIGYARVSKETGQDTAIQVAALKAAAVAPLHEEHGLAGRGDRPKLPRALDQLRMGDIFVVWKLDRLSHSLKDFLHVSKRLRRSAPASTRSLRRSTPRARPDTHADAGELCRVRALDDS